VDTNGRNRRRGGSKPGSGARDQGPAALAAAQAKAVRLAAALAGSPYRRTAATVSGVDVPEFEPTAMLVIAGRATRRNGELLRNGELHDREVEDQSGQL